MISILSHNSTSENKSFLDSDRGREMGEWRGRERKEKVRVDNSNEVKGWRNYLTKGEQ